MSIAAHEIQSQDMTIHRIYLGPQKKFHTDSPSTFHKTKLLNYHGHKPPKLLSTVSGDKICLQSGALTSGTWQATSFPMELPCTETEFTSGLFDVVAGEDISNADQFEKSKFFEGGKIDSGHLSFHPPPKSN